MEFSEACRILDLERKHTKRCIIKAYHKQALKFHPDKFGGDGTMFKQINEAKDVLLTFSSFNKDDDIDLNYQNMSYGDILLKSFKILSPNLEWNNIFLDTTFKTIIKDCKKVSLKVFENLKKDKAIETYNFIYANKNFFSIEEDLLREMKNIIKHKVSGDNIVILNPTINDLINDSVYKLELGEDVRYVPLWHHELYFDISSNDLIVKCHPDLKKNIIVDENNNIFYTHIININDVFSNDKVIVDIGGKKFTIDNNKITFSKEKQIFTFKNKGLAKININNLFDTSKRSDVYICILLTKM